MAEYRPYRSVNSAAQARLTRVKFIAVSGFLLLALILINWMRDPACGAAVRLCAGTRAVVDWRHLCAVGMAGLVDALALGGAAPAGVGMHACARPRIRYWRLAALAGRQRDRSRAIC